MKKFAVGLTIAVFFWFAGGIGVEVAWLSVDLLRQLYTDILAHYLVYKPSPQFGLNLFKVLCAIAVLYVIYTWARYGRKEAAGVATILASIATLIILVYTTSPS